jgi:hypothetical protein
MSKLARRMFRLGIALLALAGASLRAQLPLQAVGSSFDLTGFMETATLDAPGDLLAGGTLKVNGIVVTVPRNTILQMPALALTWQQVFTLAPPPYGPAQTGLALNDVPAPLTPYEVHVQGNRIGDRYIAGLVFLSQQSLNTGQGFINFLDYANGELRVGGLLGDPSTGTRVKINDPSGRFAPAYTLDRRFTIDTDNPTVRSATGYPMGLPHSDPAVKDDPLLPQSNRPRDDLTGFPQSLFTMPKPGPGITPDAFLAAPFQVGDLITYSGCLMKDGPQPSAGPLPAAGRAATYVAAHTIIANVGIYTFPGSNPAYVAVDVMILGAGGTPIAGLPQEATARTRFEGFCTDPSRVVDLFGIDGDACSSNTGDRPWGSIDVDQGAAAGGAVLGRWRFRPPGKALSMPPSGAFLPATRELRAVLRGAYNAAVPVVSGNGLITGQYHAPIFTFLFPENLAVGNPPVPFNFNEFPFLVNGTGGFSGVNAGQLTPFPGTSVPTPACNPAVVPAPPTANAGAAQAALAGATVTLTGAASTDPIGLPLTFAWTQTAGPAVVLKGATTANPTFTAPAPAAGAPSAVLTFQLVVTNTAGLVSPAALTQVTVTVSVPGPPAPPVANAGAAQAVASGAVVQLNGTATTDPNIPARPVTFLWAQTGFGGLPPVTLSSPSAATPTFRAPVITGLAPVVLTFKLTASNNLPLSATATVAVTVKPASAPQANAGPDQGVKLPAVVHLDGSLSSDPSGLPLTYAWTQVSGPAVALAASTTVSPSFITPAKPGVLGFTLTVSNGLLTSTPALVTVTVNASANDTVIITLAEYRLAQQRLTLTASSTIADGTPALTLQGYGPNGAGVAMTYAGGGLYTVTLSGVAQPNAVTVTSSFGGSATSGLTRIR